MKKLIFFAAIGMIVVLSGCGNSLNRNFKTENSEEEFTPKSLAAKCINNQIMLNNIENGRAAVADDYPEFLYELDLLDENGNPMSFDDYSEEEKGLFYEYWKEVCTDDLEQKFEMDENLFEMALFENNVFDETVDSSYRGAKPVNTEDFLKKYEKNMQKEIKKEIKQERSSSSSSSASSGSKKTNIEDGNLVPASVETYRNNYKKGRILINTCNKEESSSFYIGHASMMAYNTFGDEWVKDKDARITITSFPLNKNTVWDGQTDGVQLEPLGYWCGDNAAPTVSMFDVQKRWWSWFKNYTSPASTSDYNKAADFAIAQQGLKYNYNLVLFGMWNTDYYYCSSLVFRAWYEVSHDYDISTNPMFVSPANIANSNRTVLIKSYRNY